VLIIQKEFKKGILFVRLKGELTKNTVKILHNEVTQVVRSIKIHNVVFNISKLNKIDLTGVKALICNYNICRNNDGISMICGNNNHIKSMINNTSMFQIKDEVSAINMIRI